MRYFEENHHVKQLLYHYVCYDMLLLKYNYLNAIFKKTLILNCSELNKVSQRTLRK